MPKFFIEVELPVEGYRIVDYRKSELGETYWCPKHHKVCIKIAAYEVTKADKAPNYPVFILEEIEDGSEPIQITLS